MTPALLRAHVQAARAYDAAAVAIKGHSARTNFVYPFELQSIVARAQKVPLNCAVH